MFGPDPFLDDVDHGDPSWYGHVDAAAPWWHHAGLYWVACAVALPVVVLLAITSLAHGEAGSTASPKPARTEVGPIARSGDGELPVLSANEPVAAPPMEARASPTVAATPAAVATRGVSELEADPAQHPDWGEIDASYTPPPFVTAPSVASGWGLPGIGAGSAISGDLVGLDPQLLARLQLVAASIGRPIDIISGMRTRAEQEVLHRRFLAGSGNTAAVPGTSRHETGQAADAYVDGMALALVPGARDAAASLGLWFPVPGEAWHVEIAALAAG